MAHITFALISLLIIFPVVYFLPIGLSIKGKLSLIGIAFLIANVGLLSSLQFALWQSSLILFLLIVLCSFILERRFGEYFIFQKNNETNLDSGSRIVGFSKTEVNSHINYAEQHSSPSIQHEGINLTKDTKPTEKINEEQEIKLFDADLIYMDEDLQSLAVVYEHHNEESLKRVEEIEHLRKEAKQSPSLTQSDQKEDSIGSDEDILFLVNRVEDFSTHEINESDLIDKSNGTDQEVGYMSEIEELVFQK